MDFNWNLMEALENIRARDATMTVPSELATCFANQPPFDFGAMFQAQIISTLPFVLIFALAAIPFAELPVGFLLTLLERNSNFDRNSPPRWVEGLFVPVVGLLWFAPLALFWAGLYFHPNTHTQLWNEHVSNVWKDIESCSHSKVMPDFYEWDVGRFLREDWLLEAEYVSPRFRRVRGRAPDGRTELEVVSDLFEPRVSNIRHLTMRARVLGKEIEMETVAPVEVAHYFLLSLRDSEIPVMSTSLKPTVDELASRYNLTFVQFRELDTVEDGY